MPIYIKTINGSQYRYLQEYRGGKLHTTYLGPLNPKRKKGLAEWWRGQNERTDDDVGYAAIEKSQKEQLARLASFGRELLASALATPSQGSSEPPPSSEGTSSDLPSDPHPEGHDTPSEPSSDGLGD